ncbi:MAG: hydrogenase maturation protease [Gemmatimonadaceae bacterium]
MTINPLAENNWETLEGRAQIGELQIDGRRIRAGDRVRLAPKPRGDVFDLALAGQVASVQSIEQDFEGKFYVAVVVDEDPGRTIGPKGVGHRFFFSPEEIEWLATGDDTSTSDAPPLDILVAGIGNIFLGDDGFGVEVVQRLARRKLPPGVRVIDFGIRGYDLAYAIVAAPDHTILVDACPRSQSPGTVFVLEPDLDSLNSDESMPAVLDAHDMNPMHVLKLARSLGAELRNVLVVGCEPASLGPPEGYMGLSGPVEAAVDLAVTQIESLVARLVSENEVPHPAPTR